MRNDTLQTHSEAYSGSAGRSDLWQLMAEHQRIRRERWEKVTESYTISLPLPPRELGSNGRAHWSERARLTQQFRQAAAALWAESSAWQWPMWDGPCWVGIDWHYRGSAPDTAGAIERCKAIVDAAQDAGIIVDDAQVQGHAVQRHHTKGGPHVDVTIWREVEQ